MKTLNEAEQELLDLISGKGKWSVWGGALHTFPQDKDGGLHNACLELEKKGYIVAIKKDINHYVWRETNA